MRERTFKPRGPGKPPYRRKPGPRMGPRVRPDVVRADGAPPDGPRAASTTSVTPADGTVVLFGWHTVKAALENPQRHVRHLFATENAARRLAEDGVTLAEPPQIVRPNAIASRL